MLQRTPPSWNIGTSVLDHIPQMSHSISHLYSAEVAHEKVNELAVGVIDVQMRTLPDVCFLAE